MSSNWPMVPLGEVLDPVSRPESLDPEKTYRILGSHWYAHGLYTKEVLTGAGIQASRVYRVEHGDFVYNRLFAWKGSFAVATAENDGCYVSNEFPCFRGKPERVDLRYLWRYFGREAAWSEALGLSQGGTPTSRNRLKEDAFLRLEVPLPTLAEQLRLVERIDALAAKIEEARRLREQAENESEVFAQKQLENTRTALLRKHPDHVRLGDATKVTSGGTPSRENPAYWGGNIPWIKTGELIDGDVTKAEEQITESGVENSSAKLFPPETVLVALYGQGQTRGRTGRLLIRATTNQACAAILPCEELRPRYIQYLLRSLYREMREDSHGGAQPNWNGQMIKDLRIAVPSNPEQDSIVADLDYLHGKIADMAEEQHRSRRAIDALLPAVLDRAFKGEL